MLLECRAGVLSLLLSEGEGLLRRSRAAAGGRGGLSHPVDSQQQRQACECYRQRARVVLSQCTGRLMCALFPTCVFLIVCVGVAQVEQ